MKFVNSKLVWLTIMVLVMSSGLASIAKVHANPSVSLTMRIGDRNYVVNNLKKQMDVAPYIKNGRTYVPVRFLIEGIGGTVIWEESTKKVTATINKHKIELFVGKTDLFLDGKKRKVVDVEPEIISPGRVMVPFRLIAETAGFLVFYEDKTKTIFVKSPPPLSGSFTIRGSDTMVDLGSVWAEEFMKRYPKVNISVTGGGSGIGISALIQGTTDIAQSSRRMNQSEIDALRARGFTAHETVVGRDGLSVIVNPSNPLTGLTRDEISLIFQGKINNWKELGWEDKPIVLLSREATSGTHIFFKENIVQLRDRRAEYSPSALLLATSSAIVTEVSKNKYAIGYVGLGYASTPAVKSLKVALEKGQPYYYPSIETVQKGEYPISRPLFFYTRGKPEGLVSDFISFVLSYLGQEILADLEFVPIITVK